MTWKCTNTPKGENKLYSDAKGVVPSLDLRFAEGKNLNDYMTGQNLITFSRPVGANQSPGTYVDENGIIQLSSADQPRFDHDPTTGESLGLLVEESRTNILLNSATLSTQSVTTSATAYTLSFYGTGTVTLSGTSTAGPLVGTGANDRVTLTFTPTAGTLTLTVTGTVSNAQLEAGSFPTSYIPTTGTALTRSADDASITGSNFNSIYNTNASTIFFRGNVTAGPAGAYAVASIQKQGASRQNSVVLSRRDSAGSRFNHYESTPPGIYNIDIDINGPLWIDNSYRSIAAAIGPVSAAFADSGSLVGTDTSYQVPSSADGLDILRLGAGEGGGLNSYNCHISRLTYFPERLPDSSLQTMTTP
jgi:hypothetical protein